MTAACNGSSAILSPGQWVCKNLVALRSLNMTSIYRYSYIYTHNTLCIHVYVPLSLSPSLSLYRSLSLCLSLSLSLSLSFSLALSLSLILSLRLSLSLPISLYLSLTYSLTHSLTHSCYKVECLEDGDAFRCMPQSCSAARATKRCNTTETTAAMECCGPTKDT